MPQKQGVVAPPLRIAEESVEKTTQQLEKLLEKSESVSEQLKDLVFFRRIRKMGSKSKKFFVLLIASAVILYWRGIWSLYDLLFDYVLPEHKVTGAVISIIIGAAVLIGTGALVDMLAPISLEEEIEEEVAPARLREKS